MSDQVRRMCSNHEQGLGYCVFAENHEGACVFPPPKERTFTSAELAERVREAKLEEAEEWQQEHYTESDDAIRWATRRLLELRATAGAPEETSR